MVGKNFSCPYCATTIISNGKRVDSCLHYPPPEFEKVGQWDMAVVLRKPGRTRPLKNNIANFPG